MHFHKPSPTASEPTLVGAETLVLDRLSFIITSILRRDPVLLNCDSLVWRDASGQLMVHPLASPCQIGRNNECELAIDDPHLSRVHCVLKQEQGFWCIKDIHSRNGTWHNDERVNFAKLCSGDVIRVGSTQLVLIEYDEAHTI